MPTQEEVIYRLIPMQEDLMITNNTNLLGNYDTMAAWGKLTDFIKHMEKDQIKSGFDNLERIIHRDCKMSPQRLLEDRKIYASGRALILSTVERKHVTKKTDAAPKPTSYTKFALTNHETGTEDSYVTDVQNAQVARAHKTEWAYYQKIDEMEKKLKDTQAKLRQAEAENHGLLDRVNKLAGDKLTHNNPAITDLRDPNRPQKLAEMFGELYDNEWVDAINRLNPEQEDKLDRPCIDTLSAILKFCYSECGRVADSQLSQLEKDCCSLLFLSKQQGNHPDVPDTLKRNLLDAQHNASIITMVAAVEIVTARLVNERNLKNRAKRIPQYTSKCIKICWSMMTHHPRLFLMWPDVSKERPIRLDMFQAYTRSGDTLDFVVWPDMLLFEDGPLLRKGTVQPLAR